MREFYFSRYLKQNYDSLNKRTCKLHVFSVAEDLHFVLIYKDFIFTKSIFLMNILTKEFFLGLFKYSI